jgi:hypothetical protein
MKMYPTEMKDQIEQALRPLINTRLTDIGRAHTMEWMIFIPVARDDVLLTTDNINIEYALNIQCLWRITGPEGIIVASEDLYYAAGNDPFRNSNDFDWTPQGSNRLDERASSFKEIITNKPLTVLSVNADAVGGVSIHLSENYSVDIFPADSLGREFWRFFRRNDTNKHFVITGEGIKD